jgi:hypothetical protein
VGGSTVDDYKWYSVTRNKYIYGFGLLVTVFMAVMIGVSRFMLGAHSID